MISITRQQYDALVAAAQAAVDAQASTLDVLTLRNTIDEANDIRRYFLFVRWVETNPDNPPPKLGDVWPPTESATIELERPVSRTDVDQLLEANASNPVTVMVTTDRYGQVGLTALDDYNFQLNV